MAEVEKVKAEVAGTELEDAGGSMVGYTPAQIQHRFETLRGLSQGEMEALNKKVRRIIDWRLMPCMTLMFLMNYLDRINVSNARLAGLQEDLGMSDTVRWEPPLLSQDFGLCPFSCPP
jgi:hypothetical protein